MEIPVYLAMTAAEFRSYSPLPEHPAWLSCLFSPYGPGLSNIPKQLPPGSLLILSDRTPIRGHDPELIFQILSQTLPRLSAKGLLLDFEGPVTAESLEIIQKLVALPCPVAVSAKHARDMNCPVFVPYLPPSEPQEVHLEPWKGREIWLEVSTTAQEIIVTASGTTFRTAAVHHNLLHKDEKLHCHYGININKNEVRFTLQRKIQDVRELLETGKTMGVTLGIGLHQEFI
ncbi:MAG: hypothetical protein E7448_05030 [Ruminococcaceae bacterium]|nr:hypothetical protein [Oscillospiraceae bacterium]